MGVIGSSNKEVKWFKKQKKTPPGWPSWLYLKGFITPFSRILFPVLWRQTIKLWCESIWLKYLYSFKGLLRMRDLTQFNCLDLEKIQFGLHVSASQDRINQWVKVLFKSLYLSDKVDWTHIDFDQFITSIRSFSFEYFHWTRVIGFLIKKSVLRLLSNHSSAYLVRSELYLENVLWRFFLFARNILNYGSDDSQD